jgi:hypothetical protein
MGSGSAVPDLKTVIPYVKRKVLQVGRSFCKIICLWWTDNWIELVRKNEKKLFATYEGFFVPGFDKICVILSDLQEHSGTIWLMCITSVSDPHSLYADPEPDLHECGPKLNGPKMLCFRWIKTNLNDLCKHEYRVFDNRYALIH